MIIDAHIHYLVRDGFVDDTLQAMDEAGVAISALAALWPADFLNHRTGGNREVLRAVRRHPDRFVGLAYIDPRERKAIERVREAVDRGFRGFKLFPPAGYRVDEGRFAGVFEAIGRTGLPVLVHCGLTNLTYARRRRQLPVNSALADPVFLDPLTRLYPKTAFIVAHMGFPHLMEAWALAMANGNVILDTAGARVWPWCWVDVYNRLGRPVPIDWDRVWWGTDNCMSSKEGLAFARRRLREAGCPKAKIASVLGGCARRVLKLG
ncbi:MAG: amidohydrolase family protein [Planctomycetota bacterium]